MSAFDDEFGLFGEGSEESERRPTLGARKIASSETFNDGIEPEEDRPARSRAPRGEQRSRGGSSRPQPSRRTENPSGDPWASYRRATEVLGFVSRKLVAHPDDVAVELFTDESGKPVIELVVNPDDLGKVIGRSGRVAHALRTVVRATAEGRVSIDILDTEEAEGDVDEAGDDAGESDDA
jgi:predicted RNA-binding protein YlqC (UPF0109 family)